MRPNWKRLKNRTLGLGIGVALALAMLVCLRASAMAANGDYVEGDALVRFRDLRTAEAANLVAAAHGGKLTRHFRWLSQHAGQTVGLIHSTNRTTAALVAELRADPAVLLAEPNYRRYCSDLRTPNDTFFGLQWALQNTGQAAAGTAGTAGADISFLKAWGLARPSTNEVVVGAIDTGLDITHPDIAGNLWTNPGEIPGNGVDDDGDGYVDDVHGYDFALGTGTITDSGYHGTHVAGIIAATGNNGIGIIGVDFQAHIMALKVSSDGESIDTAAEVEAIQYATMMKGRGVNVVALNASYGGSLSSDTEESAIQAAGDAGIIFCAAAGNDSTNNDLSPTYPASYRLNNMIVVAASDQNDALATFSNFGAQSVDLAAPGVNVLSLMPVAMVTPTPYVQQSANQYSANVLLYAGTAPANGISGTLYYCNFGNPGDFPAGVSNNIALIQRGTLTFAAKVSNAMSAGAQAVVIFNNVAGNFGGTLVTAGNWIPAVSVSQADGLTLEAVAPAPATVFNAPNPALAYQYLSGTSMATPHVSGAVAFAAMNFPNETVGQRLQRLLNHTTADTNLTGIISTGGRLNLASLVDTDGNGLPDWWEQQYFGQLTGTDPTADPDHDGQDNLAEFLAGTNPTNPASVFHVNAPALVAGNGVAVAWPSVAGRYYRLLRSTNLWSGASVVQTNLAATPPVNTFTDVPPAAVPTMFYRLELEP
jgi:subtilisin family serine protease